MKQLLLLLFLLSALSVRAQQGDMMLDSSFVGTKGWRITTPSRQPGEWALQTSNDSGRSWTNIVCTIHGLDSGRLWHLIGLHPSKIHFIDDSTGFAFGRYPIYAHSYFLMRTGDAGRSWHMASEWTQLGRDNKGLAHLAPRIERKLLHFRDSARGIVYLGNIGGDLVFLETADKGKSWKHFRAPVGMKGGNHVVSMTFRDAVNGEIILHDMNMKSDKKLVTTDGGKVWQMM